MSEHGLDIYDRTMHYLKGLISLMEFIRMGIKHKKKNQHTFVDRLASNLNFIVLFPQIPTLKVYISTLCGVWQNQ